MIESNLKWMYSLEKRGITLGMERIKQLLAKIKNPQNSFPSIHIAGTNGKGSVANMLSSILQEAGYKVGLYTSPHLIKFNERIKVNDKMIFDNDLKTLIEKLKPLVTNQSFFEFTTALAFEYFREQNVDICIAEVGLGGRLDATNVLTPIVTVITNIGFDHTHLLGDTLENIAGEKAGIIKQGIPVITMAKGKALTTIKKLASQKSAKIYLVKPSFAHVLSLNGRFQQFNASIAEKTVKIIGKHGFNCPKSAIHKGLKLAKNPCRMEFLTPNLLVDSCHNMPGLLEFEREIKKLKKKWNKIIAVCGFLKDKDTQNMLSKIVSFSDFIFLTTPATKRALDPALLSPQLEGKIPFKIITNPKKALKEAKKLAYDSDLVIVVGSIYLAGAVAQTVQNFKNP